MIRKYRYGAPFDTEAVTEKIETANGAFPYGKISLEKGFDFTYVMDEDDIVYGLGEANRGINKRGYCYISNCTDDPNHTEDKRSLYGAHNFIIVSGKTTFGLFFDYPSELTFDIGYTRMDTLKVTCADADLNVYVIEGESAYDIVKQFRHLLCPDEKLLAHYVGIHENVAVLCIAVVVLNGDRHSRRGYRKHRPGE